MTIVTESSAKLPVFPHARREYTDPHVLIFAVAVFFANLGPFFGCFFGIKGPDDEWPYAW